MKRIFRIRGARYIFAFGKYEDFTNYDLDLREYVKLTKLDLRNNQLTSIDLSAQKDLTKLIFYNNLISADFLNDLPNPEKLETLCILNNDIQPT